MDGNGNALEERLGRWRDYAGRRGLSDSAVAAGENRLREAAAELQAAGLTADESFLIALKRLAVSDAVIQDFAGEYWREWDPAAAAELASPEESAAAVTGMAASALSAAAAAGHRREFLVVMALAVAAGILVQAPRLFGYPFDSAAGALFYLRNASFFVLPLLAGYFAWKRRLNRRQCLWLALPFIAAALFVNLYPYARAENGTPATLLLAALHLPIFLGLAVGLAYAGGRWRTTAARMDFIRFSGELFIYYALIAMGGGVLTGLTFALFYFIDLEIADLAGEWLLPGCAAGAVIVAAWLVESRQRVMENIAPLLARVFTPLVALVLLAFLTAMLGTGRGVDAQREALIGFDLLLVLVLGLLLYGISARRPTDKPNLFDGLTVLLIVSAIIADAVALSAIAARITEFGFSANKTAALGENLILLVNLGWAAWLYIQFLRGRADFAALERWQTAYLPVYAVWAALVIAAFPPLFGFN